MWKFVFTHALNWNLLRNLLRRKNGLHNSFLKLQNNLLYKHGFGRKQCSNSDVYDVSWKEGVHEGNGKYTRCNGDIYMGGWKGRLMYGRAVMKRLNGDLFDASFFRQEPFSDNSNARGRCSNLIQVIWRSHVKVTTV